MDTQGTFDFYEPKQASAMNETEIDAVDADAGNVPDPKNIDDISSSGESQKPDGAEIAAPNPQGSNEPDGEATGANEQVSIRTETASIFEATGLTGHFELSDEASAFPETSHEGLLALARNIEANGMLEEITVAGDPPKVVDGKRRLRACEIAGVEPTYRVLRGDIDPRAYVWAKNAERRDLSPSQRALAFALLFPKLGPGRPPGPGENCQIFDSFPLPTQGQGARKLKVSRPLINDAYKVADPNGPVTPEVREAVRQGIVTVSDAVRDNVGNAAQDVQREALSLVKEGKIRTLSGAVAKVEKEQQQRLDQLPPNFDPPTRIGKSAEFHLCSVADLKRRVKPGTVHLIVAQPPEGARIIYFSEIGSLASHALTDDGVLVVAVVATGALPEMLDQISRGGTQFIAEFSLLFPAPIAELGDPHYTEIRRAALLTFGKSGAKVPPGGDVIEVPDPSSDTANRPTELEDGLSLVVPRFASPGQVVCIPTLKGSCGAVLATLGSGCTVIGADEDQSVIDLIVTEASEPAHDSSHDPDSQ